MKHGFLKENKKSIEFKKVFENGFVLYSKFYKCFYLRNSNTNNSVGIIVKKKIGNSVIRNYEKRIVKEFYRFYNFKLKEKHDIIIIKKKKYGLFSEKKIDFEEIVDNIQKNETK